MKPKIILHRVNEIKVLDSVNLEWGVEIDLRSDIRKDGQIYLAHDPWKLGDCFEIWLREFRKRRIKGPIILNTKEDGLESRVIELLSKYSITNFFFLDTSVPTLVKSTALDRLPCFAVRLSQYEPIEHALEFVGKATWVWVDCFGGEPVRLDILKKLKREFKLCLVSPELHGAPLKDIEKFKDLASISSAVCTKYPEAWISAW